MTVTVVTAADAYDCECTGKTFILVIYNALYFLNIDTNLVPPIIMRLACLNVDACPKFLSRKPTEINHLVYFLMSNIRLPFQIEGTILYLPTRRPIKVKLKEYEGNYMLLTPNTPEWETYTTMYRDQEHVMVDYKGHIKKKDDTQSKSDHRISAVIDRSALGVASDPTWFDSSVSSLASEEINVSGVKSKTQKGRVSANELVQRLNITLGMAQNTIRGTFPWEEVQNK